MVKRINNAKIEWFQVLRLLGSICIFLYHFGYFSSKSAVLSFFVYLFFLLSGFLVLYSNNDSNDYNGFIKKRLLKTLPFYYLLTFVTYILGNFYSFLGYTPTLKELFYSLLMIPFKRAAISSESTIRPIVGIGWYLQIEIAFYLIYYVSFRISSKYKNYLSLFAIFIIIILPSFYRSNSPLYTFYILENRVSWFSIMLGMMTFLLYKNIDERKFIIFSLLILFIGFILIIYNPSRLNYALFFLGLMSICLLLNSRIKPPQILVKGGNLSNSMFFIHYYVVALINRAYIFNSINVTSILIIIAAYTISMLLSYLENKISERILTFDSNIKAH